MKFEDEVKNLANNGVLYQVVKDFNSDKGDFGPEKVTETEMGAIFENLVSRFSEADEAGEHFTSRDIIYLMTDLVIAADPRVFEGDPHPQDRLRRLHGYKPDALVHARALDGVGRGCRRDHLRSGA